MDNNRHRLYDRENGRSILVKEYDAFVIVELPRKGALSSRTCYHNDNGIPRVTNTQPEYVTTGLELAGLEYVEV